MKLTLVAAIRYLENNRLAAGDTILIDLWGDEGYELQSLSRQFEGATDFKDRDGFLFSLDNPCQNSQLKSLIAEIGRAGLAIQFIDSYPAQDDLNEGANLAVIIMHRQALRTILGHVIQNEPAHLL
jgi:hypothetical protein